MDSKDGSKNIPKGDFHNYILDAARRGCTCYFQEGMLDEGLGSHENPDVRATYNWISDALAMGKQEWETLYGSNKKTDEGNETETIMNKFKKDDTNEVHGEGCSKNV
ncbi:DUF115 domain-containing protein [Sesbania bispinosa]|nr:DUF115 domain-containing protein [Sesbania bispinosa]